MEDSTMVSVAEEIQDKKITEELPDDESHVKSDPEPVGMTNESRGQNNENGEEVPNPQIGTSESCKDSGDISRAINTEGGHAKVSEIDADESNDGAKESAIDEKKNESESSEHPDEEVGNQLKKDKVEKVRELAVAQEEVKEGSNAETIPMHDEQPHNKEKIKETPGQEKKEEPTCLVQQTANEEVQANEKGEANITKEKNRDQQEQTKGKRGAAPPPSSVPRLPVQASSRQRGSRPSARRDAMAKFQQDQTPGVRNFKLQKTSVGVSAGASIKQKILHWCSNKTRGYEGVSIENFSSSWSDGLAFCALVHHFFPSAFDFSSLKASERERNFTLAFTTAESLAGCCPLLDVSDMLLMGNKPDPFSVFTYVQSLCQHLSKIEREKKEREKAEEGKSQVETKDRGSREREEPEEEKGVVKGGVIDEETREGEGSPDDKRAPTEEDSETKMETDQNDNGVNRDLETETSI